MLNLQTRLATTLRSMAMAGAVLLAAAAPSWAVPENSLTVGDFRFVVHSCSIGAEPCAAVTLSAYGSSGVTLSGTLPATSLVALGDDLNLIIEIYGQNGATLGNVFTVLNGDTGASFGAIIYDSTVTGIDYISGTTASAGFLPQTSIALEADINGTLGQIFSFLVYTVPAPAALAVFLVGLAGLAGTARRRIPA